MYEESRIRAQEFSLFYGGIIDEHFGRLGAS